MKQFILILILSFFWGISVQGQVEAEEKIILNSSQNSERQVKNLSAPTQLDQAVNASSYQSGELIYGEAIGVDSLVMTLSPAPGSYQAGMMIRFLSTSTNTSAVTLNINNLGAVPVKKAGLYELDSNEIKAGQMVAVIFDGSSFQVLSDLNRSCPQGFVEADRNYCIEADERPGVNFWDAVNTCGDINGKICTWGQWYFACQKTGLGLNDMTNNWEWIDSGSNYGGWNDTSARIAGSTSCQDAYRSHPTTVINSYRCCYNK